jgi:hypothetical protein
VLEAAEAADEADEEVAVAVLDLKRGCTHSSVVCSPSVCTFALFACLQCRLTVTLASCDLCHACGLSVLSC